MRNFIGRLSDEEGGSFTEMALSCIIYTMVTFGIFEVSLASYTYHLIADIAREGTRWAIVRGSACHTNTAGLDNCGADQTAISNHVKSMSFSGIDSANRMTVTAQWYTPGATAPCATQCTQPGNTVQLTVNYTFPLSVPFVPSSRIQIASASRMVISQ